MGALDASFYGAPPEPLQANTTVLMEFGSALDVSSRCGRHAFGPIGGLVPVHSCVIADRGEAVRILRASDAALSGEVRKVDFVSPENAKARCDIYNRDPDRLKGLPEEACSFYALGEREARIVWANPCQTGDSLLCHELAHVNQFSKGWTDATLSPRQHWGRPPSRMALRETGPVAP